MDCIFLLLDEDQLQAFLALYWTFGFHNMLGNSWGAVQLVAFEDGLDSIDLDVFVITY
jgi:hypothetical protein